MLMVCFEKLINQSVCRFLVVRVIAINSLCYIICEFNTVKFAFKAPVFFCLTQLWGPRLLVATPQQRQSQLQQHQKLVQVFPLIPDLQSPSSK